MAHDARQAEQHGGLRHRQGDDMHAGLAQLADIRLGRHMGAGHRQEGRAQQLDQRRRGDVARHGHFQSGLDPMAAGKAAQVARRDAGNAVDLAAGGMGIGMAIEEGAHESARCDTRWLDLFLLQRLDDLGAHPGHGFGFKARTGQRQLQQAHRFGRIFFQGRNRNHQIVAVGARRKSDGLVGQGFVERLGVQVARALIDHGGGELRQSALARRVIGRSRRHRDVEGDDRQSVVFGEPDLRILAQVQVLDVGGAGSRGQAQRGGKTEKEAVHFSPPGSR